MATRNITVTCPYCGSEDVTKQGQKNGKQTYFCKNSGCPKKYFTESYTNKGCDPDVRRQVLIMAANGNGTRATARVLGISTNTVTAILAKNEKFPSSKGQGH